MKNKSIIFITHCSIKFGHGHLKRTLNLFENLKFYGKKKIYTYKSQDIFENFKSIKTDQFINYIKNINYICIIDLPYKHLNLLKNLKINSYKNNYIIDHYLNKNFYSILPGIKNFKYINLYNPNTYIFHFIFNKLININYSNVNKSKKIITIFPGSTSKISSHLKEYFVTVKEKFPEYQIKFFTIKDFQSQLKFFIQLLDSNVVITKYGVTAHECIFLGIKPYILISNEPKHIINEIFRLVNLNLANIFELNREFKVNNICPKPKKKYNYSKINQFIFDNVK